jgi:hypothetical protein
MSESDIRVNADFLEVMSCPGLRRNTVFNTARSVHIGKDIPAR